MCFYCLFLIVLIYCSDVAASIVADETNAGVTAFIAEITSMCGLRWDGIAAVNSFDYLSLSSDVVSRHSSTFCRQLHVDSFHICHAYIFVMKSYYDSKSGRLCLCMTIFFIRSES